VKREEFQDWISQTHFSNRNEYVSLVGEVRNINKILRDIRLDSGGAITAIEGIFALGTDKSVFLTYILMSEKLEQTILLRVQAQRAAQGHWTEVPSVSRDWPSAVMYENEIAELYSIRFVHEDSKE
jgi:Ni,Fe-hydrogenase III component G